MLEKHQQIQVLHNPKDLCEHLEEGQKLSLLTFYKLLHFDSSAKLKNLQNYNLYVSQWPIQPTHFILNERGESTASYKQARWVWEVNGSRLSENYQSFQRNLYAYIQSNEGKIRKTTTGNRLDLETRGFGPLCPKTPPDTAYTEWMIFIFYSFGGYYVRLGYIKYARVRTSIRPRYLLTPKINIPWHSFAVLLVCVSVWWASIINPCTYTS